MIISNSKKFIFIRTRKTASLSVAKFLYDNFYEDIDFCTDMSLFGIHPINCNKKYPDHMSLQDAINNNLIKKKDLLKRKYFIFCFERNPWTKVISSYHYHNKLAEGQEALWAKKMTFLEFVKNKIFPTDIHLYSLDDKIYAEFICDFEKLDWGLNYIIKKIKKKKITKSLPHLHKGIKINNLNDYYNYESYKIVKESFKKEIKNFNFNFPNKTKRIIYQILDLINY